MNNPTEDLVDQAISRRLSRLAQYPVDTSRLDKTIRAQIPPVPAFQLRRWFRPMMAVAASLLVMGMIALVLFHSQEAMASPAEMAQFHRDMVAGKIPTFQANSIDDANNAIAAFAAGSPRLPECPMSHDMVCCMKNVGNKKIVCALMKDDGVPITMTVGEAGCVQPPKSRTVVRNGMTYYLQPVGELNMVMTQQHNRWICLIGQVPEERLVSIAEGLKF